ncbi:MAG: Gfo/Idh/MocA family oxidoreductase [Phycisphaerales bacterium]|nr:Gfo/Idh/MocA family oxidoreductase [Phycisphaerales bacterium]
MTPTPLRVGLVGCGNISDIYITNARRLGGYTVVACADLDHDRARAKAAQHGIPAALTVDALIAHPEVELVLNLTPPAAHAAVGLAAAEAGKHVYNEKPLAIDIADARRLVETAKRRGRLVGCAPDTVLGAGYQTVRRLIDEGTIGTPVGAVGCMMYSGPERWHPDPEFFYKRGAGPLFDMGPYYLTAMMTLFGPVRRVASFARVTTPEREITSEPKKGGMIRVETPTHVCASIEFVSGPIATLIMSFDVWTHSLPCMEIFGGEGTITAPDPNGFGGPIKLRVRDEKEAREVPLDEGHAENSRGLGVIDLAAAVAEGRPPLASGELALHVLETMHAILESAASGASVTISSRVAQPPPLAPSLRALPVGAS